MLELTRNPVESTFISSTIISSENLMVLNGEGDGHFKAKENIQLPA